MDDSSFDKKVRDALLNYQDETQVNEGWSRMNRPAGNKIGTKKLLWASVAVNVALIAMIPFFYHEISQLNDRLSHIETRTQQFHQQQAEEETTAHSSVEKYNSGEHSRITLQESNEKGSFDSGTRMVEKRAVTNQQRYTSSLARDKGSAHWQNSSDEVYVSNIVFRIDSKGLNSIDLPESTLNFGKSEDKKTVEPHVKKTPKVSYSTLALIEKHKFGKGVQMEYGVSAKPSIFSSSLKYKGVGITGGLDAELWFHPFWSVQSGVSYGGIKLKNTNLSIVNDQWGSFGASLTEGSLAAVGKKINMFQIPLVLKYHYPLNDKTSFSFGAGINSAIRQSVVTSFDIRVPEYEDYHSNSYEGDEEYHTINRSFEEKGFAYLSASTHFELGINRRLKNSSYFINAGVFYEGALNDAESMGTINQFGITTRLSFRNGVLE